MFLCRSLDASTSTQEVALMIHRMYSEIKDYSICDRYVEASGYRQYEGSRQGSVGKNEGGRFREGWMDEEIFAFPRKAAGHRQDATELRLADGSNKSA